MNSKFKNKIDEFYENNLIIYDKDDFSIEVSKIKTYILKGERKKLDILHQLPSRRRNLPQ